MAAAEEKMSFILYGSYEEQLNMLTDEQAGKWIKAIYAYVRTGEKHSDDPLVAMLLSVAGHQLDIDARKYAEKKERLKEAARKAMLSAIQESELIQKVCGWAGQGSPQQDPSLPQGYQGRTVIPYPYSPALMDNQWHYKVSANNKTPYTTEVCGIRVVLVVSKRNYDTCTYYDALGRLGCTAEEASQAIRRVSNAMYASSHAEGQYSQAMSHAEGKGTVATWQGTPLYEKEKKEEDSLFTKYTVYSIPTSEDKPVRVAYQPPTESPHTAHVEGIPCDEACQSALHVLSDSLYDIDCVTTHEDSHQEWWDNYYKEYGKL